MKEEYDEELVYSEHVVCGVNVPSKFFINAFTRTASRFICPACKEVFPDLEHGKAFRHCGFEFTRFGNSLCVNKL